MFDNFGQQAIRIHRTNAPRNRPLLGKRAIQTVTDHCMFRIGCSDESGQLLKRITAEKIIGIDGRK